MAIRFSFMDSWDIVSRFFFRRNTSTQNVWRQGLNLPRTKWKSATMTQPNLAQILNRDDTAYVSTVKRMLEASHPAGWTMSIVAYQNLNPMLEACEELAREEKGKGFPADLDSFIRMLGSQFNEISEEIPKRRFAWFLQAAFIRRATEIASRKSELQSDVAAMWIMLARGSANISELLPPNALWSYDEKAYFDDINNEHDGIKYCLLIIMPAYLRKDKHLISFAESQDIFFLPV